MRLGGLQAGHHAVERVATSELEEAVGGERVERHVDAPQPGRYEVADLLLEQVAVGRERQVVAVRDRAQLLDQPPQLLAHERLAAGQPHVVHAHLAQHAHEPLDLLVGEQRVAVEPRQPLGRHAVRAAEVAAVGDRDPHVPDRAPVAVCELLPHGRWKSDLPPVLSSSSTRSMTTPGSIPLTMSYTVSAPTLHATIASISTPVRSAQRATETIVTVPASASISTSGSTCVSGSEWASGISSSVRLAAWIAAIRATAATSPFGLSPRATRAAASGDIRTTARARANRSVACFALTSTMRAVPAASRWVSSICSQLNGLASLVIVWGLGP